MVFWGLVLEPKKKYSMSEVEKSFHISMASLDLQKCDPNEETTAVVLRKHDSDFILCNLSKKRGIYNVPLNLEFELGGEINFHVAGNSTVHLTGCYVEEMEDFDSDESLDEEDDENESFENNLKDALMKKTDKILSKSSSKNGPKRKQDSSPAVSSKKSKLEEIMQESIDDDDEDDSDFDMEDGSSDDMGEEEEDDMSDDDDDDDDDEEDESTAAAFVNKMSGGKKQKNDNQQGKMNNLDAKASPKADQKKAQQGKKDKVKGQTSPQPNKAANSNGMPKRTIDGGVQVEDTLVGNGPVAKPGKMVSVYYVGRLKQNNKQFDATQSGQGFKFRLGKGEVIKGWDVGIVGMKVGSKRRLTIPAKMAYGSDGAPPQIPPNSTLVFDVELRHVK